MRRQRILASALGRSLLAVLAAAPAADAQMKNTGGGLPFVSPNGEYIAYNAMRGR